MSPESLAPAVRKMQEVHQDIVRLEAEHGGSVLEYSFLPIRRIYSGNVKDMIIILSTIALAVLFVSLMNYILLTLSALVPRARSSAFHKTFGAQAEKLQLIGFIETLILFFISLTGAVLIIAALKPFIESQFQHSIAAVMNLGMPQKDASVSSLEEDLQNKYNAEKGFRNALMAGNAVILAILVIGLLGYTTSEAGRHQKELAIRKISGATTPDILKVFILELEYIAIPSVLAGLIGVWFTVNKWMRNFAVKVPMHCGLFVLCSLAVLLSVALVAAANYYRFANRNPVEALRYE